MKEKIRNVEAALALFKIPVLRMPSGEFKVPCPYAKTLHSSGKDEDPSCSVNPDKQVFNCQACGSAGGLLKFFAQVYLGEDTKAAQFGFQKKYANLVDRFAYAVVDPDLVEQWHDALIQDEGTLLVLCEKKGLTRQTIIDNRIGLKNDRFTIPMRNAHGDFVLVKYYSMVPGISSSQKFKRRQGCRGDMLFPVSALDEDDIIIVEGELKALLLKQEGFNAVSGTRGASSWDDTWSGLFKDKNVTVLYDRDRAGDLGAKNVARSLLTIAKSIKIATLPPFADKAHNDVTDFLVTCDHSVEELWHVLNDAEDYKHKTFRESRYDTSAPCIPVSLSRIHNKDLVNEHCSFEGVVTIEGEEVWTVPSAWTVLCREDQAKVCQGCMVYNLQQPDHTIEPHEPRSLSILNLTEKQRFDILSTWSGIPKDCRAHTHDVSDSINIRFLSLREGSGLSSRKALVFVVDPSVQSLSNASVLVKGWPVSSPVTGERVFFAYAFEDPRQTLDNFGLDPEDIKTLKATYKPRGNSIKSIEAKLAEIHEDFSTHVTRITGRQDLHFAVDLAFHSALTFQFNGKATGGRVDGIILGDTSTGKSETTQKMLEFFGQGERYTVGTSSLAGIIGGVDQQKVLGKNRNSIAWGIVPTNDKGLVILEEVGNLPENTMQALRDVRTSGTCQIAKIERGSHPARTRILWVGNPGGGRAIENFSHGVKTLSTIAKEHADQRRFDFLIICSEEDIDSNEILEFELKGVEGEPKFSKESARLLVKWAWSRKPEQIQFSREAERTCIREANALGQKYASEIPLALPSMGDKLARMSVALAIRLFSTKDGKIVNVLPTHVETIVRWLNQIYSKRSCNFVNYSKKSKSQQETENPEIVRAIISGESADHPYIRRPVDLVEHLLENPMFTQSAFAQMAGIDDDSCDAVIRELLRYKAIRPVPKRGLHTFWCAPGFIKLMKKTEWVNVSNKFNEEGGY